MNIGLCSIHCPFLSSSGESAQTSPSTSSSSSGGGTVAATEFISVTGKNYRRGGKSFQLPARVPSAHQAVRSSRVHLEEVRLAWGARGDQTIQDLQNDRKVHQPVSGPAVHEFHVIIHLYPMGKGGPGKQRCAHPTSAGHEGSVIQDR